MTEEQRKNSVSSQKDGNPKVSRFVVSRLRAADMTTVAIVAISSLLVPALLLFLNPMTKAMMAGTVVAVLISFSLSVSYAFDVRAVDIFMITFT